MDKCAISSPRPFEMLPDMGIEFKSYKGLPEYQLASGMVRNLREGAMTSSISLAHCIEFLSTFFHEED